MFNVVVVFMLMKLELEEFVVWDFEEFEFIDVFSG